MHHFAPGALRRFTSHVSAILSAVLLAACGSGGVSNDNATGAGSGPVSISPATATLFSELPTKFSLSGGSGSFLVSSSDQNVVAVASNLRVNSFTVVPGDVASDTPVTLTVRDANDASATPATATLTVKPRTITNVVTITPSPSQSAACGSAICSGGDAEVKVVLAQAGIPLANRDVRFDVVSGDVRIITPDGDLLSGTATTDGSGIARIRIRAASGATSQTALLRITDLASGFSQTTSVAITSTSNSPLSAQPTTISFTGRDANTCASGIPATVIVSGGTPPYNVSQPGAFFVNPTRVDSSGSSFTVTATGQCSAGSAIAIVDSIGASVTVTATNSLGTVAVAPFIVEPQTITFTDCGQQADVVLAGGTGQYFSSSSSAFLSVSPGFNNGAFTISMPLAQSGTLVPPSATLQVGFSDGQTALPVTVEIKGNLSC